MGRKVAAKAERIRIEYISIDEVAKWPRNPKLHADAELDESFERFGFVAPAIRDDKTKRLVAGHGRLERLITWRDQGKPAPKRIDVAPDGKWLMPVVCGVSFDNAQEAEAYLLADNQITMSRGWDGPTLQAIGDDLIGGAGLLGTGFDEESIRAEMEERVAGAGIGDGESETGQGATGGKVLDGAAVDDGPEVNPTDELRTKWGTEVGQFWEIVSADGLRVHKLAIGDSTDLARMATLMEGVKAKLLKTDPPYGVNYTATKAGMRVSGLGTAQKRFGDIIDDDLDDDGLVDLLRRLWAASTPHLDKGVAVYTWHPPGARSVAFIRFFQAENLVLHRSIIWAKQQFVLTRSGMYHWSHEPCFYGWRQGDQPPWYGPKNQRSVWTVDRDVDKGMHPTSKPAELWAIAMRNHLQPGEVALDFCAGSGPVFIAAESLGCIGRGCELEPKYAAVILERMTTRGCKARLAG